MQSLHLAATGAEILEKHGEAINRMCAQDASFQELWSDYMEVTRTIHTGSLNERDEVELGRLRAALEAEILENLSIFRNQSND